MLNIRKSLIAISTTIALTSLISGCAAGLGNSTLGWCELNRPIYFSEATIEQMSDDAKRRSISHNEFGEEKCGWESTN